jgi:Tol biopolymer transport system component
VSIFAWSPDGSRIAYEAEQESIFLSGIYSSAADGSGNVKVSGTIVAGGDGVIDPWQWSPDSSRIAYRARQELANVIELYSSAPDGSDNIKLSGTMAPGGQVSHFVVE